MTSGPDSHPRPDTMKTPDQEDNIFVTIDLFSAHQVPMLVGGAPKASSPDAYIVYRQHDRRGKHWSSKLSCKGAAALIIAGLLILIEVVVQRNVEQRRSLNVTTPDLKGTATVPLKGPRSAIIARRSHQWGHVDGTQSVKHECMPGVIGRMVVDELECVFVPDDCDIHGVCQRPVNTWEGAQAHCQTFGGSLVSINSAEENDNAALLYLEEGGEEDYQGAWIGFTDNENLLSGALEGQWRWSDGSESAFARWAPGEPNQWGGEQDCAAMVGDQWDDKSCDEELHYMCSVQLPSITVYVVYGRGVVPVQIAEDATVEKLIVKFAQQIDAASVSDNVVDQHNLVLRRNSDQLVREGKTQEYLNLLNSHDYRYGYDRSRTLQSYNIYDGIYLDSGRSVRDLFGDVFCPWGDQYCWAKP